MAITISGENNNDKILAQDGVIDQISGINIVGILTATSFVGDVTGNVTGNLTGNVNSTSPLLLQTGGSERFRITGNNELGIAGANYGSSGQVLTSGGSGSAVTWSAIPTQVTIANNADNRVITGGSGTNLNGEVNLTYNGSILSVTGEITPSSHINLASGKKLSMAGDVFKIYHSTNAAIINESGDLLINQNVSNKDIKISTGSGPTERLRIDSSGRIGIGTDTMDSSAEVSITNAASSARVYMKSADNADCSIIFGSMNDAATGAIRYDHSDDSLRFYGYNNNEYARILGGALLVNRTAKYASSSEKLSVNGMTSIQYASTSAAGLYIFNTDTTGSGTVQPYIFLHDGSGIRGGLGLQYSTSNFVINANNVIQLRTGSSGVGGTERARIHSGGLLVNKTSTSDYGRFEVKGPTADDIETSDIRTKTVATFSGSTPGTTAAGKGAGIVIKPIADRGCNYFFGVANSSTNQEAIGDFIVRAGNLASSTVERFRIQSGGAFGINGENYGTSGQVLTSSGNNSAPTWTTISGTTINSNADNRVITGSGTANTLNAEGNFLHDASTCDTTIQHYEALKVVDLIIKNTNNHGNAAGARITIESGSAANTGPQFQMICGSHNWSMQVPKAAGNLEFNNNGSLAFRMNNDNNFLVNDGDVIINTSGHGISFAATGNGSGTMTNELLDDYEEGSWTPTAQSGGSGISVSSATYTKIGRIVHVQFRGYLTGTNGSTVQIGGLPYPNWQSYAHQVGPVMHNGFDFAGSEEPYPVSYITGTWSYFQMYYSRTNSNGWTAVTGNDTGGDQFITSLTYFVA